MVRELQAAKHRPFLSQTINDQLGKAARGSPGDSKSTSAYHILLPDIVNALEWKWLKTVV